MEVKHITGSKIRLHSCLLTSELLGCFTNFVKKSKNCRILYVFRNEQQSVGQAWEEANQDWEEANQAWEEANLLRIKVYV